MKKIGRKAALSALVDQLLGTYDEDQNDVIFISHSFATDVEVIKNMITEKTGISNFYENITENGV